MCNGNKIKRLLDKASVLIITIFVLFFAGTALGMPEYGHRASLNGPWEILIQIGHKGQALKFPVKVDDENKAQKLKDVLPVLGTSIKVRLKEYIPDLKLETQAVEDTGGGVVAKLKVEGKDLNQDVWLDSSDPSKRSISSSIGGVEVRKFYTDNVGKLLEKAIAKPEIEGVLSVWLKDAKKPFEFVVNLSDTISVPGSKYKIRVMEYVPHYMVDTTTKKVTNASDKPVNPAIKVKVDNGQDSHEQWIWSKFPSSPHSETDLSIRMEYSRFDVVGHEGEYILVVSEESEGWLIFSQNGKRIIEKVKTDEPYSFVDEEYYFKVKKLFGSAVIKNERKNNSEKLVNPAIVAVIEKEDSSEEMVLELRKPSHSKTDLGTMVLIFRQRQEVSN